MADIKTGGSGSTNLTPVVALILLAVLINSGLQLAQSLADGVRLTQVAAQLDKPEAEAKKMRAQLEAVATRTVQLANQGDPSAQAIVEGLRRQGINIQPGH